MSNIVKVQNLVKYYGSDANLIKAVDHTDLEIERGRFTAIIGRSGSGKSTLLHLLGGLDTPDSGKVFIEDRDMYALKGDALAAFRRDSLFDGVGKRSASTGACREESGRKRSDGCVKKHRDGRQKRRTAGNLVRGTEAAMRYRKGPCLLAGNHPGR